MGAWQMYLNFLEVCDFTLLFTTKSTDYNNKKVVLVLHKISIAQPVSDRPLCPRRLG